MHTYNEYRKEKEIINMYVLICIPNCFYAFEAALFTINKSLSGCTGLLMSSSKSLCDNMPKCTMETYFTGKKKYFLRSNSQDSKFRHLHPK